MGRRLLIKVPRGRAVIKFNFSVSPKIGDHQLCLRVKVNHNRVNRREIGGRQLPLYRHILLLERRHFERFISSDQPFFDSGSVTGFPVSFSS